MTIIYDEIAHRAFEIWKDEGEIEGREQDHWLRAEAELREKRLKEQKGKKDFVERPVHAQAAQSRKILEAIP